MKGLILIYFFYADDMQIITVYLYIYMLRALKEPFNGCNYKMVCIRLYTRKCTFNALSFCLSVYAI